MSLSSIMNKTDHTQKQPTFSHLCQCSGSGRCGGDQRQELTDSLSPSPGHACTDRDCVALAYNITCQTNEWARTVLRTLQT